MFHEIRGKKTQSHQSSILEQQRLRASMSCSSFLSKPQSIISSINSTVTLTCGRCYKWRGDEEKETNFDFLYCHMALLGVVGRNDNFSQNVARKSMHICCGRLVFNFSRAKRSQLRQFTRS